MNMISRSLRQAMAVLLTAALLIVGLASTAYAAEESTFTGSIDGNLKPACDNMGGTLFESDDGTYGVCIVDGGLSLGCDDIAVEGEDNCWVILERKVPKDARKAFNEVKDAVGGLESAGKPPRRVRVLVDALQLVAQPDYCDKKLSRRTQMLQEALTIALLEGDLGLQTCGSSDQSSPVPEPGGGSPEPSTSTTSPSTTSPQATTTSPSTTSPQATTTTAG